jgi:hypothetical protein
MSAQSTDEQNAKPALGVTNRSASVRKVSQTIRDASATLHTPTAALTADARIQKVGGSTK